MKYFLHDTNAFNDEKISRLFIKFGYEGLGLFYTILERLGAQEKPINTEVLKRQLHVGKRLEKCWSFMEEIEIISSSDGETFNERILSYSGKYEVSKEKNRERVANWRAKHAENKEDTKNVTHYVTGTKQVRNGDKVKESKVKEIERGANALPPKSFKTWTQEDFVKDLEAFKPKFPKDLLNSFYKYWSEKSPSGKMKFQLQETWETSKRLDTWQKKEETFAAKNGKHTEPPQTTDQMYRLKTLKEE